MIHNLVLHTPEKEKLVYCYESDLTYGSMHALLMFFIHMHFQFG